MPAMYASRMSSSVFEGRRVLASKFRPPFVKPPRSQDLQHTESGVVYVGRELVGVPAEEQISWLASMEPKEPFTIAILSSCWKVCPARVAWLASMFILKSPVRPYLRKKFIQVATSKSYWC